MDSSTYAIEADAEANHWWFVGRRRLLARIIARLSLSRDARILDIGTSTGTNLRLLRDLGFVAYEGLDASDQAIQWCAEKGLGTVTNGDVCAMPFADASFDFVLATDVIEHVDDDARALVEIRRVLKPGAQAVITVPAFQSLWGLQDEVAHHKRRYRAGEIRDHLARTGLHCRESYYFNYILFLPILAARRIIRRFDVRIASENEVNHPVINALLTRVFAFDVLSAPHVKPPFGVSFMAIVEKEGGERGQ